MKCRFLYLRGLPRKPVLQVGALPKRLPVYCMHSHVICLAEQGCHCVQALFSHMRSGWFAWTEPSLPTSLQGIECLQGALCTSWTRFEHLEPLLERQPHRASKYIDFFHSRSGWFSCTEPPQTTALQGIQGVQGALCTGSGRFEHIEPRRTVSRFEVVAVCEMHSFDEDRADRTSSNLFDLPFRKDSELCTQGVPYVLYTKSGRFKHTEPQRTFSTYFLTEKAR